MLKTPCDAAAAEHEVRRRAGGIDISPSSVRSRSFCTPAPRSCRTQNEGERQPLAWQQALLLMGWSAPSSRLNKVTVALAAKIARIAWVVLNRPDAKVTRALRRAVNLMKVCDQTGHKTLEAARVHAGCRIVRRHCRSRTAVKGLDWKINYRRLCQFGRDGT